MKVTVIGSGYVGLTTSAALAYIGHKVHSVDVNPARVKALQSGEVPIHENGLPELLREVGGRVSFGGWESFDNSSEVVIIAVGTPRKENGDADLSYVEGAAAEVGRRLGETLPVIVNKSTVPIGSANRVESVVSQALRAKGVAGSGARAAVASNPEFLREGVALFDTFYPDRIVIGASDTRAINVLREMYAPILEQTFSPPDFFPRPDGFSLPVLITTTPASAELIKYAANTFLAMKISFMNEIAGLSERVGADIKEVARGIGLDKRIGLQYLQAGVGWGGSCFGKDIHALMHTAGQYDYEMPMSRAAAAVNFRQREEVIHKLQSSLKVLRGSTIGLLGLSFKPGTDDLRDAPAITIAGRLLELGAYVRAYDPVAMEASKKAYPGLQVEYSKNPEELFRGADAVVLVTEWKEFSHLDYAEFGRLMKQKVIIDGRNVLNAQELRALGFNYIGFGR